MKTTIFPKCLLAHLFCIQIIIIITNTFFTINSIFILCYKHVQYVFNKKIALG